MTKSAVCRMGVENGELFGVHNIYKMVGIDLKDVSRERVWTPDGKKHLVDLYLRGWTVDEMAKELNRTPGSVVGQLYDLGEAGVIKYSLWGSKGDRPGAPGLFATGVRREEDVE